MIFISLIVTLNLIALYFIYKSYKPVLYEYKTGWYTVRSGNKYLDVDSYKRYNVTIWKSDKESLFKLKCVMHNLAIAKDIAKLVIS